MEFARPGELDTALSLLATGNWQILSGGTDFFPAHAERPVAGPVLDISAISELRGISETSDFFRIGALATWSDIISVPLPPAFDGLKLAAREVGSIQIQNRATIAGNICNASPAADGVPPLLTLDTRVELAASTGRRDTALSEFITGNRKTGLRQGEMVAAILIPKHATTGRSSFLKLGARKYLVISIAMVAARIATDGNGIVTDAAIAVGACSAVAQRLTLLEKALVGKPADGRLHRLVEPQHLTALEPIDDIRASAAYRMEAARELTSRAIQNAVCVP